MPVDLLAYVLETSVRVWTCHWLSDLADTDVNDYEKGKHSLEDVRTTRERRIDQGGETGNPATDLFVS